MEMGRLTRVQLLNRGDKCQNAAEKLNNGRKNLLTSVDVRNKVCTYTEGAPSAGHLQIMDLRAVVRLFVLSVAP